MKNFLKYTGLIITTILLNGYLNSLHYNLYDYFYSQCQAELIANSNYNDIEDAFKCVENKPIMMVLGTILFKEGSIFK